MKIIKKIVVLVFVSSAILLNLSAQAATIFGDPKGDITIIEYLDYDCPICREYTPLLAYFASQNKGIKIIQRVVPVLSVESVFVDSVVLASIKQNKFPLMQSEILTVEDPETIPSDEVLAIADHIGLNRNQLLNDMQSADVQKQLQENSKAYDATGQKAVPVTVIYLSDKPDQAIALSGYQDMGTLQTAVNQLRAGEGDHAAH